MKKSLFCTVITLFLILTTGCDHVNTDKDYYYKEYVDLNGINVEFYGKGYGTYGQLLPQYYTGSIDSIFNPDASITITTSSPDNNLASANEIYVTLTYPNLTHVNEIITAFNTQEKSQISSFKISYKGTEENEVTIAYSYNEEQTYSVNANVYSITLYVRQNKYYSSYHEIEDLRDKLCYNPFTIVQFLPN